MITVRGCGFPIDRYYHADYNVWVQPGAPGVDGGVRQTFACFAPDEEATFVLATGERPRDDADARLIAHVLVTRTLLMAGEGAGLYGVPPGAGGPMFRAYDKRTGAIAGEITDVRRFLS